MPLKLTEIYLPEISNFFNELTNKIIDFFSIIFPILLIVAIVTANISLIFGGIIYLIDYNEENGKTMVFRSFIMLMLLILLFNPQSNESSTFLGSLEDFNILTSYLTSYLLFIFAALSLIIFIANLGLYIVASDRNRLNLIKKSCFCFVCVLLPLGFQFPNMPLWRV